MIIGIAGLLKPRQMKSLVGVTYANAVGLDVHEQAILEKMLCVERLSAVRVAIWNIFSAEPTMVTGQKCC